MIISYVSHQNVVKRIKAAHLSHHTACVVQSQDATDLGVLTALIPALIHSVNVACLFFFCFFFPLFLACSVLWGTLLPLHGVKSFCQGCLLSSDSMMMDAEPVHMHDAAL